MTTPDLLVPTARPTEQVFPILSPSQMERMAKYGVRRSVAKDDVLLQPGQPLASCFLVIRGLLNVDRPTRDGFSLVVQHGPGQFTGEVAVLTGRRAVVRIRAEEPAEVVEIERKQLLRLLQVESELGEIVMRAYILRRAELIG